MSVLMFLSVASLRRVAAFVAALSVFGCAASPQTVHPAPAAVEASPAVARGPLVAAANPLAAEAGMRVLAAGGSAVDAAVAIQAVLGLVEPQSSGLGGGAFLMFFDGETGAVTAYDGRETAPSAATPELFYENGRPLGFGDAVLSGRSTGAPGVVAMLAMAQKDHGRLPWSALFDDGVRLAEEGFIVSPRLAGMINQPRVRQGRTRWADAYFTKPDGTRLQAGDRLVNVAYGRTLRTLAEQGADAFYRGEIAQEIAAVVAAEPRPGALTAEDIANYRPIRREPLCRPYRIHIICVPPPPSSGVGLLQLLAMAEHTPDIDEGAESPAAWVAFGRLQRLMYADRDRYVGDADFSGVPVDGLLDADYVAARAALVPQVNGPVEPGLPPGAAPTGPDATAEPAGTSHLVVVDRWGNAVSMTTTVESVFGSGRMAAGFFLNNQLTDFSFSPLGADGRPAANAVAAGKRPRSTMSPVIILDAHGRLEGAIGSPGGSSILAYNLKGLIAILDWGLPVQAAIDLPNLVVRGDNIGSETAMFSGSIQAALAAAGMPLRPGATEGSGLHGAMWRQGAWDAGADPRREGVVLQ